VTSNPSEITSRSSLPPERSIRQLNNYLLFRFSLFQFCLGQDIVRTKQNSIRAYYRSGYVFMMRVSKSASLQSNIPNQLGDSWSDQNHCVSRPGSSSPICLNRWQSLGESIIMVRVYSNPTVVGRSIKGLTAAADAVSAPSLLKGPITKAVVR
jgi:hypothetical protein